MAFIVHTIFRTRNSIKSICGTFPLRHPNQKRLYYCFPTPMANSFQLSTRFNNASAPSIFVSCRILATKNDGVVKELLGGVAMKNFLRSVLLICLTAITLTACGSSGKSKTTNTSDATDTTAPTVSSTNPANNAIAVAINPAITATFSESMDASTITAATFTLDNGASGTVTYDPANMIATLTPANSLAYSTTYTATITTGVMDLAGNALAGSYTWTFTTGTAPDTTPPLVSSTSPANNAADVAVNTSISASFSETMDAGTITTATFTITGVTGTVAYTGTTATFTPTGNLAYSTTYTATITTGVKDLAGNTMAGNYTWTFTTGVAPDTTPPLVSSTSPADDAADVAVNTSIIASFSETMDAATITTTTFTIAGVTGTVAYTGTIATFTPSVSLAYSTEYTATITTGVKDLSGNAMAGSYTWTFTTGTAPDTTPPLVSSTSPANNATDVAVNTAISAAFSETMDAATITTATFTIAGVIGTVAYTGTTAAFTPTGNLAHSTTYTATITTEVKDLAGNALADNYIWTFTTDSPPNKIAAGGAHTIALKLDGTLWAWGLNTTGQIGDPIPTIIQKIPMQIGTDANWTTIATGFSHTIALKSDGTLWAWGNNSSGQLGDGTTEDKNRPTQIGTDTNWTTIAAGGSHTIALKSNGTLWAWGLNTTSQIEDPIPTIIQKTPMQIGTDANWTTIATGFSSS